jgi:uncharacterized protein YidB (DUF937 family)
MSRGFPSLTALLGLLAVAGYQNRDKIAEMLGGGATQQANTGNGTAGTAGGLGGVLEGLKGASGGGFLGQGLSELIDRFKQSGQGEVADSWVRTGPNQEVGPDKLEHALGPDVLQTLIAKTGLSRQELLARLSRELPTAVDRYTPDGRLPADTAAGRA